jgi:hypothetical protein
MIDVNLQRAQLIPSKIRRIIIEQNLIKSIQKEAVYEYLFDVYEHFVDFAKEWNDYSCAKCRNHITEDWKNMESSLKELYDENT